MTNFPKIEARPREQRFASGFQLCIAVSVLCCFGDPDQRGNPVVMSTEQEGGAADSSAPAASHDLHSACRRGDMATFRALIEAGGLVNKPNEVRGPCRWFH